MAQKTAEMEPWLQPLDSLWLQQAEMLIHSEYLAVILEVAFASQWTKICITKVLFLGGKNLPNPNKIDPNIGIIIVLVLFILVLISH